MAACQYNAFWTGDVQLTLVQKFWRLFVSGLLLLGAGAVIPVDQARASISTNPGISLDFKIQLQLIQTFSSNGRLGATLLGTATQRAYIEAQIDLIWAQAGIDIEIAPTIARYTNDFAFNGMPLDYSLASGTVRPGGDLQTIVTNGDRARIGSQNPAVIDVYFVDVVPGWSAQKETSVNGYAFIGGNGIAFYVGDSMLLNSSDQELVAGVLAHEIGHNLGLQHVDNSTNLMNPWISQGRLTADQVAFVRKSGSNLLQPIPEPSTVLLLSLGVIFLCQRKLVSGKIIVKKSPLDAAAENR